MRINLIIISLLLASCSEMAVPKLGSLTAYKVIVRQGNLVTPDMRDQIKVGMPAVQVRAILGTPLVQDPFHAGRWDYLYYVKRGNRIWDRQRLTLEFESDKLVSIDARDMPDQAPPERPDSIQ